MTIEQKWSDEVRADAMRIAGEAGADKAEERLGVPAATVRWWMMRERQRAVDASLVDDDQADDVTPDAPSLIDDDRRDGPVDFTSPTDASVRLAQTAAKTLDKLERFVAAGKAREARDAGVTLGILIDKARALAQAAIDGEKHRAAVTEQQGQELVMLLRAVLAGLDLPHDQRQEAERLLGVALRALSSALAKPDASIVDVEAEVFAAVQDARPQARAERVREMSGRIRSELDRIRSERPVTGGVQGAERAGVDGEPSGGEIGRETTTEPASVEDGEPAGLTGVVPARPRRLSPADFNVRPMKPGEQWIPPHGGRPGGDAA